MNKFLFSIIISVVLFSGCKNLKEIEVTGVKGFKVNTINTSGINGDILLSLKNPNKLRFTIYKSVFDVKYSGVFLGKARLSKKVKIKANTEETYSFNLQSDFKDVNLMDIMKIVNGVNSKGNLEVKGDLKVGRFFIKKSVPVDLKEKIRLE